MIRRILIWVFGTLLFGFIFYGLWYLHNDHPFGAAMLAGLICMVQLRLIGKMADMLCRDRSAKLISAMHRIESRLDQDEQRLDEMEPEEDDIPWGVG